MVRQQYIECGRCQGLCFGDVVRAYGQYFHIQCFSCEVVGCSQDLLTDGYFVAKGNIYCRKDYHKLMGRRCAGCMKYVEGEVISALDNLYHANCFRCHLCTYVFPPDTPICYDGNHLYCTTCNTTTTTTNKHRTTTITANTQDGDDKTLTTKICVGCHLDIKTGQALMAGEKPYHLWCFKCMECNVLLTGDYMAHKDEPYCEPCYHDNFGVVCDQCNGYITGKVLQAGEKCYHPRCSKCAMCGGMFNEGEEMFLQGSQIWHPRCNKDAMRYLRIATREQPGKPNNGSTLRQEYESDASSDSTAPPPTENYDASRSHNESSEMVDPEILPTFPVMKTNAFQLPDNRRLENENKVSSTPRNKTGDIPKTYTGELVIDVNRSRNSPTTDVGKKDFYRYLMKNDHHHLDRMFQDQRALSSHVTSPSNVIHSPHSLGSPGSFGSVHSSSGFHSANSPNGYHSSTSQNAFPSANSSNCFRRAKLSNNNRIDSASSANNAIRSPREVKPPRGSPPPYESVISESSSPPIPPPPTRSSSRRWRQKHDCATFSAPSEGSSLTKAQQLQLRRLSFSKAVSTATDESRHNTLTTDYSDTFTSSLTSSSDGFDEVGDKPWLYSKYKENGLDNVLTTYA